MKTQIIDVTPEIARSWLKYNDRNRHINKFLVASYRNDMLSGNWSFTHQGIAFYDDGVLADGQHRLMAVIDSGCTIPFLVTFGLEKDSGTDIDVHRARRTVDAIRIGGLSSWISKYEASVINYLVGGYNYKKLSAHDLVDVGMRFKDHICFAINQFRTKIRGITTAPVIAAVVKASANGVDKKRLSDFCHVLISGMPESTDDVSAIRLREYLLSTRDAGASRGGRIDQHLKCQRAIKAFLNREKISKLYTPNEDIYKIEIYI